MNRHYKTIPAAALLLAALLTACAADPALDALIGEARAAAAQATKALERPAAVSYEGESWRFGLAYTGEFTPFAAADTVDGQLALLLYDRLFVLDETGKPAPSLCESYTFEGNTYTLTLRKNKTFSDGAPVTAADAAWSVLAAATEGFLPASRSKILSAEAADDRTLTVVTEEPDGGLPAALAAAPILPAGSPRTGFPPGSGPYALVREPGGALSLAARDRGAGIPAAALIRCDTPEELLLQAQTGGVSLLRAVPSATDALTPHGLFQVRELPTPRLHYLIFNTRRAPLRDAAARRALSAALSRPALAGADADAAFTLTPAWAYVTPPTAAEAAEAALDGAAALSAVFPAGTALELLVNAENARKKEAAEAVRAQWEAAGLSVSLRILSWEAYGQALAAGSFDVAYAETELPADFSLDALLGTGGALNYGKYGNKETDALLAAYRQAPVSARPAAMAEIQARLDADCPLAPLFFVRAAVYSPAGRLTNAAPHWYNLFAGIADWRFAG